MHWLIGSWPHLGIVAAKAALMYATALIGLRLAERRTMAQWTITDFVVAVAVGTIVARTAIASTQAYITGAVALVTLIVAHWLIARLRFQPKLERIIDHQPRILVEHGQVRHRELRRCAVTLGDLHTQLRQRGVFALHGVRYVLYEPKGAVTVVPETAATAGEAELVSAAIERAAGHEAPHTSGGKYA